ncbi:hypothetical protein PCIT_a1699 [Pseudoalteromonas citrea]|uniref:Uncharacterized protein n=1 Tax=Pseudoalteromonas citrea TaxID=43655 RepID=A0AAD4FTY9_9GAMM|nr:hypothetical protein [Pseudoalteromonas citrea]KAF7775497.1 hypothetical protein PCIT_a1699 [Pseudoalteromonas citrea]
MEGLKVVSIVTPAPDLCQEEKSKVLEGGELNCLVHLLRRKDKQVITANLSGLA